MGNPFKKFHRSVKKRVKKIGYGIDKAASTPFRVVRSVARGESSTKTIKQIGRGFGGLYSLTPISDSAFQRAFRSDTLNRLTLGTTKSLSNIDEGFRSMSKQQTVQSGFYRGLADIGAKVAAGYAIAGYAGASGAASAKMASTNAAIAGQSGSITLTTTTKALGTAATTETAATAAASTAAKYTVKDYVMAGVLGKSLLSGQGISGTAADYFGLPTLENYDSSGGGGGAMAPGYEAEVIDAGPSMMSMALIGAAALSIYLISRKK